MVVPANAAMLPTLLLLVGIFAHTSDAETIEDTAEWKACIANPAGCTVLNLGGRGLTGSIPAAIGGFYNMKTLYLHGNGLTGSIAPEICKCKKLEIIYLYSNKLTGSIPKAIGTCTSVTHLYLQSNQLSGQIPTEIQGCKKLRALNLQNNALSGSIPREMFYSRALMHLYVFSCFFKFICVLLLSVFVIALDVDQSAFKFYSHHLLLSLFTICNHPF